MKNRDEPDRGFGKAIREVIHYYTIRRKFTSVHPELRRKGIIRVEVEEEGLRFVQDTGCNILSEKYDTGQRKFGLQLILGKQQTALLLVRTKQQKRRRRSW